MMADVYEALGEETKAIPYLDEVFYNFYYKNKLIYKNILNSILLL